MDIGMHGIGMDNVFDERVVRSLPPESDASERGCPTGWEPFLTYERAAAQASMIAVKAVGPCRYERDYKIRKFPRKVWRHDTSS